MKNLFCILSTLALLAGMTSACTKPAQACFSYSPGSNISTATVVTFNASCTKYGGGIYKWSFGDGTTDTTVTGVATIAHTFSNSGTFVVTLEANRKDGVVLQETNQYITHRTVTVQ